MDKLDMAIIRLTFALDRTKPVKVTPRVKVVFGRRKRSQLRSGRVRV